MACAAHELRTPLATQRALLELALADPDADITCWREVGEDVLHACMHQERLLEACLTLARSHAGLLRSEPVDLATIAAAALRANETGTLEVATALGRAWTSGAPELLERLAANLVSNAIRHNAEGGRISIATHTDSGYAILAVTNTGPLISTGELRRLFQPFQRLKSTPRSLSEGVGLGLAIVAAIADAHGGSITARAQPAGGLQVEVSFPACPS